MEKEYYWLGILLFLLILVNYSYLDSKLEEFLGAKEFGIVQRVIDGDTVVIDNESVRLLGINSPERGEFYYDEAKEFLENLILNETVIIENYGKDRYHRSLAYLFFEGENVNLGLVKVGLANIYFPSGKNKYYSEFSSVWKNCRKNLCEKSNEKCASCIKLKEFDYKNQKIILENICSLDCDLSAWQIKDEGRKKFIFKDFILNSYGEVEIGIDSGDLIWEGETYIWTKTGDTLFLRDKEGGLVLWENY